MIVVFHSKCSTQGIALCRMKDSSSEASPQADWVPLGHHRNRTNLGFLRLFHFNTLDHLLQISVFLFFSFQNGLFQLSDPFQSEQLESCWKGKRDTGTEGMVTDQQW